jgi:hypothetical protein
MNFLLSRKKISYGQISSQEKFLTSTRNLTFIKYTVSNFLTNIICAVVERNFRTNKTQLLKRVSYD